MNQKGKKWDGEDPQGWYPIEEFMDLPAIKYLGWTEKTILNMIRMKLINSVEETSSRAHLINMQELRIAVLLYSMKMELNRGTVETDSLEDLDEDLDGQCFSFFSRKLFGREVRPRELKEFFDTNS